MADDLESQIQAAGRRLLEASEEREPFLFTPDWWQERMLEWATGDENFRVKLLRFVDVLPALRSAKAVADHVRLYFREDSPPLIEVGSELAGQPLFRPVVSRIVREGVYQMAHRFIAGETPKQAVARLHDLARHATAYTVDLLGEATMSEAEADVYGRRYAELIEVLSAEAPGPEGGVWQSVPRVNLSIKLSALCSQFEVAAPEQVCEVVAGRLRPLLRLARERGAFINVDMEQLRYKDLVHHCFAAVLSEPEFASVNDVGIVVQAYLKDAETDVQRLAELAQQRGAPFSVRLVKGAYWEEERIVASQNDWPVPVYEDKDATDASFERCTDVLIAAWPHLRPAFGTHNPRSVAQALVKSENAGLAKGDIEFQMLYGMAEDLREAVAKDGYRTRVYVPVGAVIPGMAYLVRRLLENTSNQAWFLRGGEGASMEQLLAAPKPGGEPPPGVETRGIEPVANTPAPKNVGPTASALSAEASTGTSPPSTAAGTFYHTPPARFFEPHVREAMQAAIGHARSGFGGDQPLLIGEKKVTEREMAEVRYPADPSLLLGRVAQATVEDVNDAVAQASDAYPAWRDRPATVRADILRRAADIMESRRFDLAGLMVFESAKPWHEADGDVVEACDYLRFYAKEAERLMRPVAMEPVLGEENIYVREGRGIVAVIAPWNFPLAIICGMSSAALAAGNCAVLKPAAQSPLIAARLVEILREAGVPPEVVHYLPGPGSSVGQALVDHPDISVIAFTGSKGVGLSMVRSAAEVKPGQREVKRIIAEMGGKNAIIVDDDADLDQAVAGVVTSAFGYAGQKCSACSRLIIVGSAYDELLSRLGPAVESLIVGPPHDPSTFVPPIIGKRQQAKIEEYISNGLKTSRLLVQGRRPEGDGSYVPPTVFVDVPRDDPLAREEIFGPVLSVFHVETFDEGLALAMDSEYALTGGVYSRNPRNIEKARREFRTGSLYINRKTTGAIVGRHPFGGLQMSGVGDKAGGPDYLLQFLQPRTISENTMRRGFAPESISSQGTRAS